MSADYKGRALCDLSVLTTFSPALEGDQTTERNPNPTKAKPIVGRRPKTTATNREPARPGGSDGPDHDGPGQ
ncbi:hypothetical protein GCM10009687_22560 [Asanoa iriomotensis]|uniref:Transposase n=1 Tax=Asanoa iriomotensis TaxID=234613 RepID=A0ABQ4CF11_9ACTN|nr:hypothetical protein Air01nite_74540 [Asanoa iriomotensis]